MCVCVSVSVSVCLSVSKNEGAGRVKFKGFSQRLILSSHLCLRLQNLFWTNKYSSRQFSVAYILWCLWRRMYCYYSQISEKKTAEFYVPGYSFFTYLFACIYLRNLALIWIYYKGTNIKWNFLHDSVSTGSHNFVILRFLNLALWYTYVIRTNTMHTFYINILI